MSGSRKIAIVTSRLRRLMVPNEPWLMGLRGVLRRVAEDGDTLLIGNATAGSDLILHAARRLEIPYELAAKTNEAGQEPSEPPRRDRALIFDADVVYVLNLRTGGNVYRLLRERLTTGQGAVIITDLPQLQVDTVRTELQQLGAQFFRPSLEQCAPLEPLPSNHGNDEPRASNISNDVYLVAPFPQDDDWTMLTHTTRSCPGPWPGQSFDSYADRLFESHREADHSSLGTLLRIVQQRRLIASAKTIRGDYKVVSFTACPLGQIPALHRFRPHRIRWDFEPYGICIRSKWLQDRGACPVSYGCEADWNSMSDAERPFFQVASGDSGIDWSVEREWRHPGDLDLGDLAPEDVLLFVPNFEAAKSLSKVVAWPITLWPGVENSSTFMNSSK